MEPNCFGIIKGEQPLVCNGDDRGQRPKQGGAVGAAACRMRVPRKAQSRRREPASANTVCRYDLSREKANQEDPQIFLSRKY